MSTNLWRRLKQLIPDAPLLVGTVDSISSYGAVVLLPDGAPIAVRGAATLGQKVFIRDGLIEGLAPSLTDVLIEI